MQRSRYSDWLRAGRSEDRIPVWGKNFRTCPSRPWGSSSLLYNGYRVFPGGKERPGRDSDPSSPSSAVVVKGQSYTSTPPIGRTACTEPQCLYKGALYLTFFCFNIDKLSYVGSVCEIHNTVGSCFVAGTLIRRRPSSLNFGFLFGRVYWLLSHFSVRLAWCAELPSGPHTYKNDVVLI